MCSNGSGTLGKEPPHVSFQTQGHRTWELNQTLPLRFQNFRLAVFITLVLASTILAAPLVDQGQPIHFNFLQDECLGIRGDVPGDGTPVQVSNCTGAPTQQWVINRGSTQVRIAGTEFCLDAGENPADGVQLKSWRCYDDLPAQQWFYTDDNRIVLRNQALCTDLENGDFTTGSNAQVQTWTCSDNNMNQVWTLDPVVDTQAGM